MKVIKQKKGGDLVVDTMQNLTWIDQNGYSVCVTKQGAKQLIKLLQEWVDEK